MEAYEHEIEIKAPIDYTFEWGLEPTNWQRVMPAVSSIEFIESTDDGERYRTTYKMFGRSVTEESVFRIIEPNAHVVSTMEGPDMTGEMHYYYTETDTGTNLRFVAEFGSRKNASSEIESHQEVA